jgi:signal transduction histidine kinase/DNA-binding response OmpR family regulator
MCQESQLMTTPPDTLTDTFLPALLAALPQGIVLRDSEGHDRLRNAAAEHLAAMPEDSLTRRLVTLEDGGSIEITTDCSGDRAQARDVAAAQAAAERAGQARADFLAVMSHEIRTPLNGILGVAALLQDLPLGTPIGPDERDCLAMIAKSGQHLLQLVNDILDFSRLDAGRLTLERTAFDLRGLVRNVIELLQPEARRRGLELGLELAADLPLRAAGDPARIRQVLLNLAGNAIKFTQTGSVAVSVKMIEDDGALVRILFSVTDTGIGIAPEALGRLFEAFEQADSSISRRFGGSGLGLAISRQLVRQMGGEIAVESRPGVGSIFRFDVVLSARRASDRLPVGEDGTLAAPPPPEPPPLPAERAALAPMRVLIADDNATNRAVASRILERNGHRVRSVENGKEAVVAVQEEAFDLVLMDMMMPVLDGLAATRRIRALTPPVRDIPIVGLTANSEPEDIAACRLAGMNAVATKPISAAKLLEAMADAVAPLAVSADPATASAASSAIGKTHVPLAQENRRFDPAVLDRMLRHSRNSGEDDAEVARGIDGFIGRAAELITAIRAAHGDGDAATLAQRAHDLGPDAARLGLMRPARAALDLGDEADPAALETFVVSLGTGLDELREWRRSALRGY